MQQKQRLLNSAAANEEGACFNSCDMVLNETSLLAFETWLPLLLIYLLDSGGEHRERETEEASCFVQCAVTASN